MTLMISRIEAWLLMATLHFSNLFFQKRLVSRRGFSVNFDVDKANEVYNNGTKTATDGAKLTDNFVVVWFIFLGKKVEILDSSGFYGTTLSILKPFFA